MPEVSKDQLNTMLADVPEAEHEQFLTHLKQKGYTLAGAKPAPGAAPLPHQPIYPQTPEISKPAAAWGALKESWNTDVPGLAQAHEAVANKIPDWMANKGGQMGATQNNPGIQDKAVAAGTAIGTAGEFIPNTVGDLVMLGVAPALKIAGEALPGAAKAVKGVAGAAARNSGEVLAEIFAKVTGAHPEAVKAVFKDPKIATKFAEKLGQWDQANLVQAVNDSLKKLGGRFQSLQDGLAGFSVQDRAQLARVDLKGALSNTLQHMVDTGHRVAKALSGEAPGLKVGRLAQDSPDYHLVTKKMAELKQLAGKGLDFGEALNFRRQIDDLIDFGQAGNQGLQKVGDEGNRVLKKMRDEINGGLREALPAAKRKAWDEANKAYSEARRAYDEIKRESAGLTPQQTIMKVMRQVRTGRAEAGLHDKAAKIGIDAEKAFADIHDRVVASQFHDFIRGGIATPAAAAYFGQHFGGVPGMALGIAGSSPRAVGYGIAGAGSAAKMAEELATKAMAHPSSLALGASALLRQHQPLAETP